MKAKIPPLEEYRQSTLAGFETCPRRTRFAIQRGDDDFATGYVGTAGLLGTAFHAVVAEILRTLYRQGEPQMPTQEAVEVMYEVMASTGIVLPADDRETLRYLVLKFCEFPWRPQRILALEQPLRTTLVGPDGVGRVLKGQPDMLVADPPKGVIIVDWKTGYAPPRSPRQMPAEGEPVRGKQYLSERGHFQLDVYGLLAMHTHPTIQYATLRELHLRSGSIREATLERYELEHVEREIAMQMQLLDEAIEAGPKSRLWDPRPGHHCQRQCPVARSCPIPKEARGVGGIDGPEDADRVAGQFVMIDGLRQNLREMLKGHVEQTGYHPQVGDGTVLRKKDGDKGTFGVFPPLEAE